MMDVAAAKTGALRDSKTSSRGGRGSSPGAELGKELMRATKEVESVGMMLY